MDMKGNKVILITTALDFGGITSFLIPLVNELVKRNEVTLAYTKDCSDFCSLINKDVNLLCYKAPSKKHRIVTAIKNFRVLDLIRVFARNRKKHSAIAAVQRLDYIWADDTFISDEKYDVAISAAEFFCNAVVANGINAKKKIGWVHPDISALQIDLKAAQRIIDKLDKVIAVSEAGIESLKRLFPACRDKFIHIENMMDDERIIAGSKDTVDDFPDEDGVKRIVTVCRIDNSSKRIDRIIKIAKLLKEKKESFKWYIIGDGKDYESVKAEVLQHNLQDCIALLGKKANPYPYMSQADCFVLTSQYEGKPIVIEEAKILHTPIVVTAYTAAYNQVPPELGAVVENCDGVLEEKIAGYIADDDWLKNVRKTNRGYKSDNLESICRIYDLIGE